MDYKYCPLCATELLYRPLFGRQRQQCPACNWIYFKDPKVGAGAFVEQDGKAILVRRGINPGRGLWCFPSGFMEIDESPEQAAIREYKEETGLDIELTGLLDIFHYQNDFRGAGILILYQARLIGGTPTPMDDVTEIGFFGPDNLPEDQIAFKTNYTVLMAWKQRKLGV